jgi:hypothetical protein
MRQTHCCEDFLSVENCKRMLGFDGFRCHPPKVERCLFCDGLEIEKFAKEVRSDFRRIRDAGRRA